MLGGASVEAGQFHLAVTVVGQRGQGLVHSVTVHDRAKGVQLDADQSRGHRADAGWSRHGWGNAHSGQSDGGAQSGGTTEEASSADFFLLQ
ncbi:hypothetical protein D3C74_435880 [compost metagenome]